VTREWRRPCNEELRDFCCSPDIATVMKLRARRRGGGGCSTHVRQHKRIEVFGLKYSYLRKKVTCKAFRIVRRLKWVLKE
jgi:hypothetical protein